ncbi:amidohydrolase family protein [Marinomonas shanghaiensis]|uniref:amidohydrolase family protein n=1 Tax=Marinomonas shanghaiensis TaxID=2202418 RepID=UPI000DBAD493|nr:amidohydrolase family protein [Marinomonas shanghaiensis]
MSHSSNSTHQDKMLEAWQQRMLVSSPNPNPNKEWLSQVEEAPLLPELPIVDAHHHLWDRSGFRYLLEEYADDIGFSGRNVVASVFVQCRSMYRQDGPERMKPVGEVEFVRGIAAQARSGYYGKTKVAAAIVGGADLLLGREVASVLDAMQEAGGRLFKGVRTPVAAHPDPVIRSNPVPVPEGLMLTKAFIAGAEQLVQRDLLLDLWVYQTQLTEVARLAQAQPNLRIVINHAGGPLGLGLYKFDREQHFADWRAALAELAACPNVFIKLGGFGMPIMGFEFHSKSRPPSSVELAKCIAPYINACIELFGHDRCMFESNFPVDKGSYSYGVLWNAFCRVAELWNVQARDQVFHATASRLYQIDRDK